MRLCVVRLEAQRLAVALQRLVVAPQRRQRGSTIIVGLGESGFQLDRLIETVERLLVALQRVEDQAMVEQNLWRRLARAHCRQNQLQCFRRLASRELDQCQHLQGIEMIGPDFENVGIEPSRPPPAGPVHAIAALAPAPAAR